MALYVFQAISRPFSGFGQSSDVFQVVARHYVWQKFTVHVGIVVDLEGPA